MLCADGLRLAFAGDFFEEHYAVSNLVGVKDVWRQRVAPSVAGAAVGVNPDVGHRRHARGTGKVSGSHSTDRSAAVYVSSVPGLIS